VVRAVVLAVFSRLVFPAAAVFLSVSANVHGRSVGMARVLVP